MPFKVSEQFFAHPLTDRGSDAFLEDWEKSRPVVGEIIHPPKRTSPHGKLLSSFTARKENPEGKTEGYKCRNRSIQKRRKNLPAKRRELAPSIQAALQTFSKADFTDSLITALQQGQVNLNDPATTLALLKLNSVVGVTGFFNVQGTLRSVGIQCAFCHSTVDNSLAPGIGQRLDGWPNRDLNVGAVVSLAPNLTPFTDLLGVDANTVKSVLATWGPGCYDAELDKDGKALRPDGKRACTLIPPAFGLAGVNLHTWTGFGSVPNWNAYVGVTQMHGSGTFFDARLSDPTQYPLAAKDGSYNTRGVPDLVTSKLPALHFYQLAIPAPKPPAGSFDEDAAARGKEIFNGQGKCSTCHIPPLYTEPGNNLHAPSEIGVDSFQADRSPTHMYRTSPLKGLWGHTNGGFYHDGRFATLNDVIQHYNSFLGLGLTDQQVHDLVEYLKSL